MKPLIKKRAGAGDLFVSLVAIMAITLVVFMYMNTIADVQLRTSLDQVGRKYILIMESEGNLSSTEKTKLIQEVKAITPDIKAVSVSTTGGNGYGTLVTLKITCTAYTTNVAENSIIPKRNRLTQYVIEKQSTAKY